jgi:O-antigen/teichoic acid export membrane protein
MNRSFLGHAAIYGLGSLIMQAAGFVLLPLYLRCLSREELGTLELATRLAETVGTLLLLGGFRQALFALYAQAQTPVEKRRIVTATYALLIAMLGIGIALFVPLSVVNILPAPILLLAVLSVILEPFLLMPLCLMQARSESLWYVGLVAIQFFVRVALALWLVAWWGWGILGVLSAQAIVVWIAGFALFRTGVTSRRVLAELSLMCEPSSALPFRLVPSGAFVFLCCITATVFSSGRMRLPAKWVNMALPISLACS